MAVHIGDNRVCYPYFGRPLIRFFVGVRTKDEVVRGEMDCSNCGLAPVEDCHLFNFSNPDMLHLSRVLRAQDVVVGLGSKRLRTYVEG